MVAMHRTTVAQYLGVGRLWLWLQCWLGERSVSVVKERGLDLGCLGVFSESPTFGMIVSSVPSRNLQFQRGLETSFMRKLAWRATHFET